MSSRLLRKLCLAAALLFGGTAAHAQYSSGVIDIDENLRIEKIEVVLDNRSNDEALNGKIADSVRRAIAVFPGDSVSRSRLDFALIAARRQPYVDKIGYSIENTSTGGAILVVNVSIVTAGEQQKPRGLLATQSLSDFPVLYDSNGTFFKVRLEALSMYYGNNNAWYGQPNVFLQGNPLVSGTPAGAGYSNWVEGFVHTGVYGITPINDSVYAYGGVSAILSGSAGQELFTNQNRAYLGLEDAFVGVVGGKTGDAGDRLIFNVSAGRQRYTLGDGFLIINTAQNGGVRAALQSNPRWAADFLGLAQVRYNNVKAEAFYLAPNELQVIDTHTKLVGVNVEAKLGMSIDLAGTFIAVPQSTYQYYTPTQTFSRQGLRVWDARFRWQPNPSGMSGVYVAGEAAVQTNANFPMLADGFYGEVGYAFEDLPWRPTLSYRYAQFSGDNPSSSRFGRWDPLYSGGTGEQWVQGLNDFKLFQDSNLTTHRFQMLLWPAPQVQLVPQFWIFSATSLTNLGGNPALSFLGAHGIGTEANMTAKWFVSRNVLLQGGVAATFPGAAITEALGAKPGPWLSTMAFLRVAF